MVKKYSNAEAFEPIKRIGDFLHWMESKYPRILKRYEEEVNQLFLEHRSLEDENIRLTKKKDELTRELEKLKKEKETIA